VQKTAILGGFLIFICCYLFFYKTNIVGLIAPFVAPLSLF